MMESPTDGMGPVRLCVSALSGGGGKTLLSLGLARLLARRGFAVKPFKKGPDYIDAAWLALAAGQSTTNLDPFFLEPPRLRGLFAASMGRFAEAGRQPATQAVALIEGNRGLYDGLDEHGSCSTAHLANLLECPVLLCIDCTKMTRTVAAVVQGVTHFADAPKIAGLVLNRVASPRHERILRAALREYADVPVVGAIPKLVEDFLPERHMGIASRGEDVAQDADRRLDRLADALAPHLDIDRLLALLREQPPLPLSASLPRGMPPSGTARPRIGYVEDAAFWFYYPENLEALADAGADLVRLPLLPGADGTQAASVWDSLDGLYIGGGFPEDYAAQLSVSPQLAQIAALSRAGLPIYAECGGFMLLARSLRCGEDVWPMSGVFDVDVEFCRKPQGLGYVQATVRAGNPFFPAGMPLRGHEFHYSRCIWPDAPPPFALALSRGQGMGQNDGQAGDGLVRNQTYAAYTHIFAPAVPCWARNFVLAAQAHANGTQGEVPCA